MESLTDAVRQALAPRYLIERELGRGGMATVFLARDTKHDRNVAIKVLSPELAQAIGSDRFLREIEVVAGLNHPHILPLHDSGDESGIFYYVMPYVAGGSLRARIDRSGPLPEKDAVQITRGIAGALGFAHRNGIVHRDVKPGNILLNEGHALLADFGIAHLVQGDPSGLTATGIALGTPTYESPEQASGESQVDGRTDIYSLGCVLYESLAGHPPFEAASARAILTQHLVLPPPRIRSERADVSDGVEEVIDTALQKDPEDRFQTGEEMAGALDLVTSSRTAPPIEPPAPRLGRPWRLGGVIAAVLTVLALTLWLRPERSGGEVLPTADALYLVLPVESQGMTERDSLHADRIVRHLRQHLDEWSAVRSVPTLAIEKPVSEVRLAGMSLPENRLELGLQLARQLGANRLVYVEALSEGDSTSATARLWVLEDQVREDSLFREVGRVDALNEIAAGFALRLFGIDGVAADYEQLLNRSASPAANRQFQEGVEALEKWRLVEAEQHFRAAIEADDEFALAHQYLATTLYWRTQQDHELMLSLGTEIERHSRRADEYGTGDRLRPGERAHVNAFRSFWTGDFEHARTRFDSLISMNPSDIHSLVLRGAVEWEDPVAVTGSSGQPWPRADWGVARAKFEAAADLNAQRELGWGQLFDIDMTVMQSAMLNGAVGFDPPGSEARRPYDEASAVEQVWFVPVFESGSFRWLRDPIDDTTRILVRREANETLRQTRDRLEELGRIEPALPRHQRELADLLRRFVGWGRCDSDEMEADTLLREADSRFRRALALQNDTTPQDLVRLANFALGHVPPDSTLHLAQRGLELMGDWKDPEGRPPPLEAANPYLFVGSTDVPVQILERVYGTATDAVDYVTEEGQYEDLDTGPVLGGQLSLQALGIASDDTVAMQDLLGAIFWAWDRLDYTPGHSIALRVGTLHRVSPALIQLPSARARWFEGWDEYPVEIPPVWRGILAADTDPDAARYWLDSTLVQLEAGTMPLYLGRPEYRPIVLSATDFHEPLVLATMLGADSVKDALLARLGRCALSRGGADAGWAVRWRWMEGVK